MIKINGTEVNFEKFPNGEIRLNIKEILHSGNKMAYLFFKWENDSDFMKLFYLKKELDKYCHRIDLVIAYMPYSRMDRTEGEFAFTLKWICDFINDMNFDSVKVVEAHSDVTCALLNNCSNVSIIRELFDLHYSHVREQDLTIFFPDAGAYKKYAKLFVDYPNIAFGNKVRDFKTGDITSYDIVGEIGSLTKVVIVDDLCSYGGTFIKAAESIMSGHWKPLYIELVVAHCEKSIVDGDLLINKNINHIITTDSIISNIGTYNKLKITNLEKIINF